MTHGYACLYAVKIMKVCIDVQSAVVQRAGVGRYTQQLVTHLGALAGDDHLTLFSFDFKRRGLPLSVPGATETAVHWIPGRAVQWGWKRLNWPPFDRLAGSADLYHFPNFVRPPLRRGKSVVTIHDMSFVRYPRFAEDGNLRFLNARIQDTARRADAIITDSSFSAGEIRDLLPVAGDRVFPIPLGIGDDFAAPPVERVRAVRERLGLGRPYLLTVGTLEPRKNVAFLVDVFERLDAFDGDFVIAGMRGWKCEATLDRLKTSSRADRIRYLDYVPGADLPALYAGAELFVIASHYEGFGFPPLEAMACGVPVVSSNGGSLGEILGDAAVVLDAFDRDDWIARIGRVLTDVDWRNRLVAAGRDRAAGFTWNETARRTWEVYRKVAS